MGSTAKERTLYGTYDASSDPDSTPHPPPLGRHCPLCGETLWAAYHNLSYCDDLGRRGAFHPANPALSPPGLSAVPPPLPPRSRGPVGLTHARVCSRCHDRSRYPALCTAP